MEVGKFYDLTPPSNIQGKVFHKVQCSFQVPGKQNEFVVKGIPKDGDIAEDFVLKFTGTGKVVPTESNEQSF